MYIVKEFFLFFMYFSVFGSVQRILQKLKNSNFVHLYLMNVVMIVLCVHRCLTRRCCIVT